MNIQEASKNLKEKEIAFERAMYVINDEIKFEQNKIRQRIMEKHSATIEPFKKELNDAIQSLKDAQDSKTHPWEGKKVFRWRTKRSEWGREQGKFMEIGIVEISRNNTKFPINMADYSKPKLGDLFIRATKKDGSPSLKTIVKRFRNNKIGDEWRLYDENVHGKP